MFTPFPESGYRQPIKEIPTFQASTIESAISDYRTMLQGLGKGAESYDFTARPISWQDIQAQQVSATGAAREAMAFNEANMGRYTAMAQELTRADVASKTAMLDQFVPDWRQKRDKAAAINDALMRGEIPKDVADQLKRTAAYTSVMGGGGVGTQRALTARDLGTTSLALQTQGMAGAANWTQMMANLMPEQTRAADVMATQGLTSAQTLATALSNAAQSLEAAKTNVQGRATTAYQSEALRLEGEKEKAAADYNRASLLSTGFGNILKSRADLESEKYKVQTMASLIAYENMQNVKPEWKWRTQIGGGYFWQEQYPTYTYGAGTSASGYGFGIR